MSAVLSVLQAPWFLHGVLLLYVTPAIVMMAWNIELLRRWREGISPEVMFSTPWLKANPVQPVECFPTKADVLEVLIRPVFPGVNFCDFAFSVCLLAVLQTHQWLTIWKAHRALQQYMR